MNVALSQFKTKLAAILTVTYTATAFALGVPKVRWLGSELPFKKLEKRSEYPFNIRGHTRGAVVLIPDKQLASNEGRLLIKTDAGEKEPSATFHDYWIKAVGLAQLKPGADSIVIHYYMPMNHEAKDEYLVCYTPESGELVWCRFQNYWRQGDPKFTTSENYDAPGNNQARSMLAELSKERLNK